MKQLKAPKPFYLIAPLAMALAACGGGGSSSDAPAPAPAPAPTPAAPIAISIPFIAVANNANTPVTCESGLKAQGSTPTDAQLADLRFYLTDIALVNDKGETVPVTLDANEWQLTSGSDKVVLIDLENGKGGCAAEGTATTNALIKGTVPAGSYTQLKATVGVPEKLSHSDVMAAKAPLDLMAMGWSWQAGRKFAKIELNPVGGVSTPSGGSTSIVSTYFLHLASTNCTGPGDGSDTCAKKNLAQFAIPFNLSTQQVAIDLGSMFSGSDIRKNQNEAVGCMSATSDLDCPAIFGKFGLDLATGGNATTAQSVFRAIAK
ncbi:MbnP family copper-binding protein [Paucibacter sp. KBW04]|uniref:MbnP family copper-binding protein n=1 Tax=Paucibacter sp. KBW04 TaxID=2153361 RepID=UPI000F581C65|nr:MbnP family copper-binding protein [Paucibacter sp. KBW04]